MVFVHMFVAILKGIPSAIIKIPKTCDYCNRPFKKLRVKCNYCGGYFCDDHYTPDSHMCSENS